MADIMRDVNTAFETAIRRDPVNWLWVHNRWKLVQRKKKK
jgi:lauroyl/myristoyl acyltransferase